MTARTESANAEWSLRDHLLAGHVIPAHPLALDEQRRLDVRYQRALSRYYLAAGAGGLAVGVHTTQFATRAAGLYAPVLEIAAEVATSYRDRRVALIAGAIGKTSQAVREAEIARSIGYDAVLLSLGALRDADENALVEHCASVAAVLPLFGFYLQPAVGGRVLSYEFWRRLAELPELVAIKIAPFDRYRTLDVLRAIADSGRLDVALYTGNDDNIVGDLLAPYVTRDGTPLRFTGGLLGQWAVWTRRAVEMLDAIKASRGDGVVSPWLSRATAITDANAAIFDVRHEFAGCIPGIHEVLRRQGLLRGTWCLDPDEQLSPGQSEEIDRVIRTYPWLTDDAFVAEHLDEWLA